MNVDTVSEAPLSPRARVEAAAEPLPPLLYRSEAFDEDLEADAPSDAGLTRRLRSRLGELLYVLPLGLSLLGASSTLWAGSPF